MKAQLRQLLWGILFTILLTASHSAFAFFDPTVGRWISRDPIGENGGLNLYAQVDNNPVGEIDPLGQERFKIWASAYIPDATFRFPYPDKLDRSARWYGDNRKGAQVGGSSRAYHFIIVETDPKLAPTVQNFSAGGLTKVDYSPGNWSPITIPTMGDIYKPFTDIALDAAPPKATITRSTGGHTTIVTFSADTSDPLVRVAPSLHYQYTLMFDVCRGKLTITGDHKKFPGYDLIVNGTPYVDYMPSGLLGGPLGPAGLGIPFTDPVGPIVVPIQKYP